MQDLETSWTNLHKFKFKGRKGNIEQFPQIKTNDN